MINFNKVFALSVFVIFSSTVSAETKYRLTAVYLPIHDVAADIDPKELNGGQLFDHKLDVGHGGGLKLSQLNHEYRGASDISLAYYQGNQNDLDTNLNVQSHSLFLEAGPEFHFFPKDNIRPFLSFLVGAGVVKFDFQNNQSKEWSSAVETGVQLGFKISRNLKFSAGGNYFLWGYPTETIGHGIQVSTEIGFEF